MNYDTNKFYAYEIEDFFEFFKDSIKSDAKGKYQDIKHKLYLIVNSNISSDIMNANSERPVYPLETRDKESLKFALHNFKEARRFCKSFLSSKSTISFFFYNEKFLFE